MITRRWSSDAFKLLLVICDGAAIHRSQPVKDVLSKTRGRLGVERLPPYAPELNPVEYVWSHLKQHEIANLVPRTGLELSVHAVRALLRMRRRPRVIITCWKQSELWP